MSRWPAGGQHSALVLVDLARRVVRPQQPDQLIDVGARLYREILELDPHNSSLLFKLSHARRRELQYLQQAIS